MILPDASRGLRCQPVEKGGAMSKRGKGWASVLRTILSRGRRSSGEKRRYKYFSVSACSTFCQLRFRKKTTTRVSEGQGKRGKGGR